MTDDEALKHLAWRGIEQGVIDVLQSMLAARPQPKQQIASDYPLVQNIRGKRRGWRYSPQRDCVLAAINVLYPEGVPKEMSRAKLKRHVADLIDKSADQPWYCAVTEEVIGDHVVAYLADRNG